MNIKAKSSAGTIVNVKIDSSKLTRIYFLTQITSMLYPDDIILDVTFEPTENKQAVIELLANTENICRNLNDAMCK